jgi:mandelate racemase
MTLSSLTIRSLDATAVSVPMRRPFGTSAQTFRSAPLLLVTLETEEGVTGRGYAFCYLESVARAMRLIAGDLNGLLAGHPVSPLQISKALARYFKLTGLYGPLCMLASAIDTAAWDALAICAQMPLAVFLGGSLEPVPAYNSNGLGLISPGHAADEADQAVVHGRSGRGSCGTEETVR